MKGARVKKGGLASGILTRLDAPASFCCMRDERRWDAPISPLYTAARGPAWEASEGLPASYWR